MVYHFHHALLKKLEKTLGKIMSMKTALMFTSLMVGLSNDFAPSLKGSRASYPPSEETLRKRDERKRKKKHAKKWSKK